MVQTEHRDVVSEVQHLAERIEQLLQTGQEPNAIAVLVRQQEQARAIAAELRSMGIPTVERAATDLFERPEVRQALHRLRTAALLEPDADAVETVTTIAQGLGWAQASGPSEPSAPQSATWDSLAILVEVARRLQEQDPQTVVFDVLEELERRAESFDIPAAPAVSILTMHAAKGLEWDVVFIPGASARSSESRERDAAGQAARDEEARLLYVAVTRARRQVFLSWSREAGGRSPLLAELPLGPQTT
ncbi:MAG: ATP-dependent helicase [Actinobacteria bacterium]|nr:ATP-dependent helicase [Actinomycetota bacterium]